MVFVLALTALLIACGRMGPDAPPDKTPPAIVATTPSDLAPNVAPNAAISITLSEPVDAGTINFRLVSILDGAPVPCTMSYSGTTAVCTPDHDLAYYTSYNAWVGAGVKDLAGNSMTYDTSWSFTTSQAPDTTPPRVVDIQPSKRKTGVSPSTVIAIMFSEPMDPSTIKSATIKLSTVAGDIPGTISYNGAIAAAIFIPDNSLFSNTYIVTVTTGVKDLAKNAMTDAFVSSFKTGTTKDTTRPSVSSVFPAFGATAGVNTPISITFSEPMNVSTITPTNITVSDGNTTIPGELKYYETTAVFTPSNPLQYPSSYTVNIAKEVTDLSGNGMSADYSWTFTMESNAPDTVQPYVLSPSPFPANNQSKVPVYKQIVALFSEKMLASSITPATFTFVDQDGASVQGHFAAGGATAVFVPAQPLAYSKTYTATITSGPTDIIGNALQGNSPGGYTWSFTTEAVASFTVTATAGENGSITPSRLVSVNYGASQTFTITSAANYHVADVLVDGSLVDAVTSYTFTNVTDDHTISASFAIDTFTVTPSVSGGNGSISPSSPQTVSYNGTTSFTLLPAAGYHAVMSGTCGGTLSGDGLTYTTAAVTTNCTVVASFAINTYTVSPSVSGGNGSISPSFPQTVSYNGTTSFTLLPATGYHAVMSGTCGGTLSGDGLTYTTAAVISDCTVMASFAINSLTITTSVGTGGIISPANPSVNYGANQTFTITPNTGYHVVDVLADGVSIYPETSYTFTNVTTNHTISASFAIDTFIIQASADSNGSISPSGAVSVNYGAGQTFTFMPNTGYYISLVTVDGAPVQGLPNSYTFTNVTAKHTIRVSFELGSNTITTTAGTGGTITSEGTTVPSGTSQSFLVMYGGSRQFTIASNTGYHVVDVLADGVSIYPATSYTFTNVTTNHTISAIFAINTFTVTPSVTGGNGTISPSTALHVDYNGTATFTIKPNTGYHIATVTGCEGTLAGDIYTTGTYTTGPIAVDCTVTASFAINTYTISTTTDLNGSIDPSESIMVSHGASQAFTISPNTGYHIFRVLVDDFSVGAVTTYTFTNVTSDHTISAGFAINTFMVTPSVTGGNGTINPSSALQVDYNGTTTFTLTPDTGYVIESVTGCNGTLTVDSYATGPITDECTVTASFTTAP